MASVLPATTARAQTNFPQSDGAHLYSFDGSEWSFSGDDARLFFDGQQQYVTKLILTVPGGASYSSVELRYSASSFGSTGAVAVAVTAADGVGFNDSDSGSAIRAGTSYGSFNISQTGGAGQVVLNAAGVTRVNEIAQAGGGAFEIGLSGTLAVDYYNLELSSLQMQGTEESTAVITPTVTTPANNSVLTSPTVSLSGTVTPGATYRVQLGGDASNGAGTPVVATGGTWTQTLTGLSNGSYIVRVTDQTNSRSSPFTNFSVAVPLAFDTISVSGNILTVTGTAGVAVPGYVQLFDASFDPLDGADVTNGGDGTWTVVLDMGARPTGTYNIRLDDYGGTTVNETFAYSDTTLPATPILLSPSTANPITTGSVVLSGTAEPNADVAVYLDSLQAGSRRADSSGAWTFTISGSGAVRVNLEAFDASGNRSGLSQPYDFNFVDAPTIDSISPNSGPPGGGTSVVITGTEFDGSTSVSFGGVSATGVAYNGPTQITATSPAGTGVVDVRVTKSGVTSVIVPAARFTYAVPGTLSVTGAPAILARGNTATITVTPSVAPANGSLTVNLNLSGSAGGTLSTNALTFTDASPQTFTFTAANPSGFRNIQYSLSGPDAGAFTAPAASTINVVAGNISITGAPSDMTVGDVATITVTPSSSPPNGDLVLTLAQTGSGDLNRSSLTFTTATAQTFTYTATAPGPVTIQLLRGGADSQAYAETFTININVTAPIPTISTISPAVGSTSAPAPVTISGGNFSASGNSVTFGGVAGSVTAQSATSITVTPPTSATQGLVDVVVTNAGNQSVTRDDGYRYLLPPTLVAEFSPTTFGTNGFGTLELTFTNSNDVAVSGLALSESQLPAGLTNGGTNNFCNNTTIVPGPGRFEIVGGSLAANASCTVGIGISSTTAASYSVTTGVPSIDAPVAIAGSAATTTTPLTVIQAPTLETITPNAGPLSGGTSITITGTGLDGATYVSIFNGVATDIVVASDGLSLTATTGATFFAGTYSVFVRTPGGDVDGLAFTYLAEPAIFSVGPDSGPAEGGTVVTLSGVNFSGATAVTFGGVPATSFTVDDDNNITATTPAGAAGAVPVAVTTAGGTATRTDGYTYVAPPEVSISVDMAVTFEDSGGVLTFQVIRGVGPPDPLTVNVSYSGTASEGDDYVGATSQVVIPAFSAVGFLTLTPNADATIEPNETVIVTVEPGAGYTVGANASDTGFILNDDFAVLSVNDVIAAEGPGGTTNFVFTVSLSDPAGPDGVTFDVTTVDDTATSPDDYLGVSAQSFTIPEGQSSVNVSVAVVGDSIFEADERFFLDVSSVIGANVGDGRGVGTIVNDDIPAAPVILLPTSGTVSNVVRPVVSGAALPGASVTLSLDGGPVASTLADGSGNWALIWPFDLPTNTYSLTATATIAGTTSAPSAPVTYRVDAIAPTVPVVVSPDPADVIYDVTIDLIGSAEPLSSVIVFVDGNEAGGTSADANGVWTFSVVGPTSGSSDVVVTLIGEDDVGNRSSVSPPYTYTFDLTPLAAPVVTSPATGQQTRDNTPTFTGTTAANATVTIRLGGTIQATTVADGTGAWSVDLPAQPDGENVYSVAATRGTFISSEQSVTLTIDTVAPAVPVIFFPSEGQFLPALPGMFGRADTGSLVTVVIDGADYTTVRATSTGQWFIQVTGTPLTDGPHTVAVRAADDLGNTSALGPVTNFIVDTIVPAAPVFSTPAEGALLGTLRPTFTGTAEANSTVLLRFNGIGPEIANVDGTGAWSFTAYRDLPQGAVTVTALAADGAGNASPEAALGVTIDVAAPAAPMVLVPAEGSTLSDSTPTVSGAAEPLSTVTVTIDGAAAGTATADGSGAWSFTTSTLAEGSHTVRATAADAVGNVSPSSGTLNFTIDTTAPAAPVITTPVDGLVTDNGTPTISGTAEAGSTVRLSVNGAAPISVTASGGGAWSYTPPSDLTAGQNTLSAVAVDAAGNASPASATVRFTYSPISIVTTSLASGRVGAAYDATIQVSGGTSPYDVTVTAGALPAGITLSRAGVLSGVPTTSGAFSFTVTATDANGLSVSRALSLPIAPPAEPEVTDVQDVEVTANPGGADQPTTIDLSSSVRNAARIEIVTPPAFGTATVDGFQVVYVPNVGYFGRDSFTYRAIGFDDGGSPGAAPKDGPFSAASEPATVSIVIAAPTLSLAGGALPSTQAGVAYAQTLTASGGTAPYSYAVTGGALPAGIVLASDGTLSGTPTSGGTFSFTVTATDSSTGTGPFSVSAVYTLAIDAPTLAVTPPTLANATTAQAYSQAFSTTGGVAPYAYAVTAGTLPTGLALSPAGVLSGTPTQGGTFGFTVTATDASTGAGPYSASQAVTLTVAASNIAVTPTSLADGTRGTAYSASLSASGGVAPYSYAIASGALPAGLTLSTTGQISGTPTVVGTFAFQVRATDSATGTGPFAGVTDLSLTIASAVLAVTPTTLPDVLAGVSYSQQLAASGGQGGYSFAVTAGALPDGLTLSASGLLSGRPGTAGRFAFTVTATDSLGNTGTAPLSVTVAGRPDPSADPDVRGLTSAQAEATRQMLDTQIGTFSRRLEQLHQGADAQRELSLNLTLDASAFASLDNDPRSRGPLAQIRGGEGQRDLSGLDELRRMIQPQEPGPSSANAEAMNAGPQQGGAAPARTGPRVWAGGAISLGERDATTRTAEMSVSTSGISVGVDMSVTDTLDLGVGVGFGQENTDVGIDDTRLEADSWVGVAYGSWRPQGDLFLDGILGYSELGFGTRRRTPVDQSLVFGERDGTAWFGSLSAGLDRTTGAVRWIGYGRVDGLSADLDAYVETGSPIWALSFEARELESLQGSLGLRYERQLLRRDHRWTPGARVEWTREFGDAGAQILRYADWLQGPGFSIDQEGWDRSRLTLGLSLDWASTSGWSWSGEYQGGFSDGATLNQLRIKLAKTF